MPDGSENLHEGTKRVVFSIDTQSNGNSLGKSFPLKYTLTTDSHRHTHSVWSEVNNSKLWLLLNLIIERYQNVNNQTPCYDVVQQKQPLSLYSYICESSLYHEGFGGAITNYNYTQSL